MRSLAGVVHLLGSVLALFAVLFLLPIGAALYFHERARAGRLSPARAASAARRARDPRHDASASAPTSSRATATCS